MCSLYSFQILFDFIISVLKKNDKLPVCCENHFTSDLQPLILIMIMPSKEKEFLNWVLQQLYDIINEVKY